MELHARLVHAEAGLRVVEVRARRDGRSLGSALAEAPTVQEAEDQAMARLLQRLDSGAAAALSRPATLSAAGGPGDGPSREPRVARPRPATGPLSSPGSSAGAPAGSRAEPAPLGLPLATAATAPPSPGRGTAAAGPAAAADLPAIPARPPVAASIAADPADAGTDGPASDPEEEPPADPEDWSQELVAVDLQLRRLGWSRDQEGLYLQRAFGHPSRSRLTRYSDLRAYLVALEGLERGSDPAVAVVPLRRSELLAQGDALLTQLGWNAEQGRAFLERELNRLSRQQLSDVQLLQFNMLLEGELLSGDDAAPKAAPDGAQR